MLPEINNIYLLYSECSNIRLTWKDSLISHNYQGQPNQPGIWTFAQWSAELRCIAPVEGSCHSTICFWFCPDFSAPVLNVLKYSCLVYEPRVILDKTVKQMTSLLGILTFSLQLPRCPMTCSPGTHVLAKFLSHSKPSKVFHI